MPNYGNQIPADENEVPTLPSQDNWLASLRDSVSREDTVPEGSPGKAYGHTYVEPQ